MLVVVDDVEVRRCVQAVSVVEAKVRNVGCVSHSRDLVPAFKVSSSVFVNMRVLVYCTFVAHVYILCMCVCVRACVCVYFSVCVRACMRVISNGLCTKLAF